MKTFTRLLRYFFRLLYHQLAGLYDLVAWIVSLGAWKNWVGSTLEFIEGQQILELGPGPGHLQTALFGSGVSPIGIDESKPMLRRASQQIGRKGFRPHLVCGLAQELPFCSEQFDTVVSTFPAEYITDTRTLSEVRRILKPGGRFVILPWAIRIETRWLFEVTHQGPSTAFDKLESSLVKSGFKTRTEVLRRRNGTIAIILARKQAAK